MSDGAGIQSQPVNTPTASTTASGGLPFRPTNGGSGSIQAVVMPDPTQIKAVADSGQQADQGGKSKEHLESGPGPMISGETGGEKGIEEVVEIPTQVEVEKKVELQGVAEAVKKEETIAPQVVDDYTGEVLLKSVNPTNSKVVLPLTEEQTKEGLHHAIVESIRWLAVWCIRQAKALQGRVMYKQPNQGV